MSRVNVFKPFAIFTVLLTLVACSPQAKEESIPFVEGTDYQIIRPTASSTPQIIEHFSLYCGSCYQTEALLASLKKSLADTVEFKRSHVIFLPQKHPNWGKLMTFSVASAQRLAVEEPFVAKVFNSHFKQQKMIGDYRQVQQVFAELGIDEATLKATINDEKTVDVVREMVNQASADKVRFTPDLIVNNKYRVLLAALPQRAEALNQPIDATLIQLVDFLVANP